MTNIDAPERARFWGVEVEEGGDWRHLEHNGERWFSVEAVPPAASLAQLAAAVPGKQLRVVWTEQDKRRVIGRSWPLSFQPVAPADAALRTTTPEPPKEAPAATPEEPKKKKKKNGAAASPGALPVAFPVPDDESLLAPLSYLFHIHHLVQEQANGARAESRSFFQMMLESERARSDQALESMRLHYQLESGTQKQLNKTLRRQAEASAQVNKSEASSLADTVEKLAAQLEGYKDQADEASEELAELATNPGDAERIIKGLQKVIESAVNSDFGKPVGEAVASMIGTRFAPPTA